MKKWTKIAAGAAAVLLIGAGVWCCWPSKEPVFKGKRLKEYMNEYFHSHVGMANFTSEETEALRFFGTNTVPYIRAALRARDDQLDRRALRWLSAKAPWLRIRVQDAKIERLTAIWTYYLILTEDYWGDAGAACEADARLLLNDPDFQTKLTALSTINYMDSWKGARARQRQHGLPAKAGSP